MAERNRRNRNENYDQTDIELFLRLVEEHKSLIESMKQDDKKKGWELIQQSFNDNCKGPERDIPALRMKLKNHKAHSRRSNNTGDKNDESTLVELEEMQTDEDGSQIKFLIAKKRKRSKMFTQAEQDFLQSLVEKYSECLDISQTREAIASRHRSWNSIHEEFNAAKINVDRELSELKIKYKNMKSNGLNFTTSDLRENSQEESSYTIEELPPPSPVKVVKKIVEKSPPAIRVTRLERPTAATRKKRLIEVHDEESEDEFDTEDDDIEDLTFIPLAKKSKYSTPKIIEASTEDKDETRLRKENLLLKNACLRKKERLLELQIALAERSLRRQMSR